MNIDGFKTDMDLWDEVKGNHEREVKSLAGGREEVDK